MLPSATAGEEEEGGRRGKEEGRRNEQGGRRSKEEEEGARRRREEGRNSERDRCFVACLRGGEKMWQMRPPSRKSGDVESAGGMPSPLYPTMLESPQLRWAFIRKIYSILAVQLLLTVAVASVVVFVRPIPHFFVSSGAGLGIYICLIILPLIGTLYIVENISTPSFPGANQSVVRLSGFYPEGSPLFSSVGFWQ